MATEHVDVLIVGAGLSGVGAACQLRRRCPDRTYAILEARDAIGGTWDLFRYPGVRSDSDMFTLGYSFRPWDGAEAIADGARIREYVRDTAREYGVDSAIRFRHRVIRAEWRSDTAQWTVTVDRGNEAGPVELTCSFLFCCSGYYRYDEGYTPRFPGVADYRGQVVHPQHWPADLDYRDRQVVVIGSGATAVTLVPAMAAEAAHVTMVQRSPSYLAVMPSRDPIAGALRRWLPRRAIYPIVRWKNVLFSVFSYQLSRRRPATMRKLLRRGVVAELPAGFDVDTHFTPRYDPWDQRLCLVQDADLFRAIRAGRVSVLTAEIETFTERGLRLTSGTEVDADIVVAATGLNLLAVGGMRLVVDGAEVDLPQTVAYKGMMLSGVPNFALTVGYTNGTWTLKSDLVSTYVCRLLAYLDRHGYASCTPVAPPTDQLVPLINLTSGYVRRAVDVLPRQGPRAPWRLYQNYPRDLIMMRHRSVADRGMRFTRLDPARSTSPAK